MLLTGLFRAVYVPRGRHGVVFRYRPSGFDLGLAVVRGSGLLLAVVLLAWPRRWPLALLAILVLIVLTSSVTVEEGHLAPHPRWAGSFHRFTWGVGIEAMREKATR